MGGVGRQQYIGSLAMTINVEKLMIGTIVGAEVRRGPSL